MRITFFKDLGAREAAQVDWTWEQLCEWIARVAVYPSKHAMPLIKLGAFGEQRTAAGSLRHDANLLAISGLEGDYDGGVMTLREAAERLQAAGIRAFLYTSPSHHPDRPRWRVLCPLANERPPSERRALMARINGVLGGILSSESFTTSQAFYVGRLEGADYAFH